MKKYNWTDLGNAERFADTYRGKLLHVREQKMWLERTEERWMPLSDDEVVKFAKDVIRRVQEDEARNPNAAGFLKQIESRQSITNMLSLAKAEPNISVSINQFDTDPWYLNCPNGILDLKRGTLIQHSLDQKVTKLTNTEYRYDSTPHLWLSFLSDITCGNQNLVDFIQKAVGYCLTGLTKEQCIFILYGSGENGKSTFVEVIRGIIGDYGAAANPCSFTYKQDRGPRNDLARLKDRRFVTAVETGEAGRLDEVMVKQITGNDTIVARFLYKEEFEFRPTWKIFLSTNHRPRIQGTDRAIWRRIRLLPFNAIFDKDKCDKDMFKKLLLEKEAIFAWAVEGCLRWQSEGLNPPPEIEKAVQQYRMDMNKFGAFISEKCYIHHEARTTIQDLYECYNVWCIENDENPLTKIAFNRKLIDQNPSITRSKNDTIRVWKGLGLKKVISLQHVDEEDNGNNGTAF